MTGQEAIELIHQRAWTGRKPGLERTQALLASLGNPERRLRFVHITGTNGKGSTAAMTASILAQAGLRAGLFTSPHLYRFHERMQVNGAPIPDEVLGRLTQQVLEVAEGMSDPPTEFELMTAVGMEFFLEEQCDIVVLEVGLGGRLDSTNVIPAPEAAVITNIGLEHTQELGGTLTLIAREKSGILKPGCRAVLYRQSDEVTQVIQSVCRQLDIPLRQTDPQELEVLSSGLEGQDFRYRGRGPTASPCWAATSSPTPSPPWRWCRHSGMPAGPSRRRRQPGDWPRPSGPAAWAGPPLPRLHRGRRPQPPVRGRPCRRPGEPLPRPEAHFPLRCPGR